MRPKCKAPEKAVQSAQGVRGRCTGVIILARMVFRLVDISHTLLTMTVALMVKS